MKDLKQQMLFCSLFYVRYFSDGRRTEFNRNNLFDVGRKRIYIWMINK